MLAIAALDDRGGEREEIFFHRKARFDSGEDENEEEDEDDGALLFFRIILILGWVAAELHEFFAHGEAGDAKPASSFGLVSLGQFNRASEERSFGSLQ